MKKLSWGFFLIFFLGGCSKKTEAGKKEEGKSKQALFIIASQGFRDEEFREPQKLLKAKGVKITVASSSLKPSKGMLGMVVKPEILVKKIEVEKYDAILFIGGIGAKEFFKDKHIHQIVKKAFKKKKIIGAICIAPSILANAGILKGKKATSFSSELQNLKDKGARIIAKDVVIDGRIITASGPQAASKFARAIAKMMKLK
jgi:protease I